MNLISGLVTPVMTRTVWHSLEAKHRLEPIIMRVGHNWEFIERRLVLAGARGAVLQPLSPQSYMNVLPWVYQNGLHMRVIRSVKPWQGFAHRYEAYDGLDAMRVVAIARDPYMLDSPEEHLGYPPCCMAFFARIFPKYLDPIWQWADGVTTDDGHVTSIMADPRSSPMLRYINVRLVPHIPCGPQCEDSFKLGDTVTALMTPEDKDAAWSLLEAPMAWDCYRGVSIVTHPDFRLIVGSVPAAERYVVNVNIR